MIPRRSMMISRPLQPQLRCFSLIPPNNTSFSSQSFRSSPSLLPIPFRRTNISTIRSTSTSSRREDAYAFYAPLTGCNGEVLRTGVTTSATAIATATATAACVLVVSVVAMMEGSDSSLFVSKTKTARAACEEKEQELQESLPGAGEPLPLLAGAIATRHSNHKHYYQHPQRSLSKPNAAASLFHRYMLQHQPQHNLQQELEKYQDQEPQPLPSLQLQRAFTLTTTATPTQTPTPPVVGGVHRRPNNDDPNEGVYAAERVFQQGPCAREWNTWKHPKKSTTSASSSSSPLWRRRFYALANLDDHNHQDDDDEDPNHHHRSSSKDRAAFEACRNLHANLYTLIALDVREKDLMTHQQHKQQKQKHQPQQKHPQTYQHPPQSQPPMVPVPLTVVELDSMMESSAEARQVDAHNTHTHAHAQVVQMNWSVWRDFLRDHQAIVAHYRRVMQQNGNIRYRGPLWRRFSKMNIDNPQLVTISARIPTHMMVLPVLTQDKGERHHAHEPSSLCVLLSYGVALDQHDRVIGYVEPSPSTSHSSYAEPSHSSYAEPPTGEFLELPITMIPGLTESIRIQVLFKKQPNHHNHNHHPTTMIMAETPDIPVEYGASAPLIALQNQRTRIERRGSVVRNTTTTNTTTPTPSSSSSSSSTTSSSTASSSTALSSSSSSTTASSTSALHPQSQ